MFFKSKDLPDLFKPDTVPAPVGGLNAYDSIAAMPSTDALIMQNWWPQPYGASIRKGYAEWATGMPSSVETLAGWADIGGTKKLFAWSSTFMYDITSRAAVGAAMLSGLSNARWETTNLTNAAGGNLICVNGTDSGIIYKGAGVFRITAGDGIVVNTWAGLNPASATCLAVHQKRLWAVEKNSTRCWYLPPDAIQGTFLSFDFGPQLKRGGFIQFLTTWTLDDGNGAEDHLVAVSSEGEAVVYGGTDPNNGSTWAMVGVYYVGSPVAGARAYSKVGGDLMILTQQGLVSMTSLLVSTKVAEQAQAVTTKKIQYLVSELVSTYGTLNGWDVKYHPPINMVLINVPSLVAGGNAQLVANQITGAWAQFTNMDAACWLSYDDLLYFGDFTGRVYQAWTGYSDGVLLDNSGSAGVEAVVQQAYNYFGGRANQKQIGMYRPTFVTGGVVTFNTEIVYDFVDANVDSPTGVPTVSGSAWGVARWGTGLWGGGSNVQKNWVQASGMGVAASLKMVSLSISEVLWVSTDYTLQQSRGVL